MNCLQKRKKNTIDYEYLLQINFDCDKIFELSTEKKKDIDNKKKKKKYNNTKVFWISRFHKVSDSSLR